MYPTWYLDKNPGSPKLPGILFECFEYNSKTTNSLRAFWYLEKPGNKGFVVIDVAYRYLTVGYSLPSTTTNHVFKERNTTMSKIIFAMYNQETDSVEVTLDNQFHITFNCQNCNAQVKLTSPLNISYLPRLAREEPGFYASLASRKGGLQGYVEAMGEFN